jgi:hypothetical protein
VHADLDAGTRVVVELGTESELELIRFWADPGKEYPGTFVAYALHTTAGWVFIDPVRPPRNGADRLQRLIRERPVATVLTSDGHERFSHQVRQQWGTPVWGPVLGEAQRDAAYDVPPDHRYAEGDSLPGGLRAIKLAGAWRGDHALLWPAPSGIRVLFTGDILNGQIEPDLAEEDHFRRLPGLYFGARARYVERHANPAALKASLERLLREEFDVLAGSHSRVFRDNPKSALARLIATI